MNNVNDKKNNYFHDGFTLIEAIVAMGVISVGMVGSMVLLAKSSSQSSILKDRVVAAHLAAEGVEIVHNIRDSNWLDPGNPGWRDGLADTTVGIVDYNSTLVGTSDSSDARRCLNWNGSVYRHATAPSYACTTTFKRHMELATKSETIGTTNVDYLEVKSIVEWKEKGLTKSLTVIDHLYDWK